MDFAGTVSDRSATMAVCFLAVASPFLFAGYGGDTRGWNGEDCENCIAGERGFLYSVDLSTFCREYCAMWRRFLYRCGSSFFRELGCSGEVEEKCWEGRLVVAIVEFEGFLGFRVSAMSDQ